MKRLPAAVAVGLASLLAACGGSNTASLSTASILGEAPAAATADAPGIKAGDPMARPVQVAWTSARAEKCGFNFDPTRLRANYLAFEQQSGGDPARLQSVAGVYDQTLTKVKASMGSAESYCTEQKAAEIKSDLTRHLAGNYEAKVTKTADSGGIFGYLSDKQPEQKFDAKTIWQDLEDRRNGVRRAKAE